LILEVGTVVLTQKRVPDRPEILPELLACLVRPVVGSPEVRCPIDTTVFQALLHVSQLFPVTFAGFVIFQLVEKIGEVPPVFFQGGNQFVPESGMDGGMT